MYQKPHLWGLWTRPKLFPSKQLQCKIKTLFSAWSSGVYLHSSNRVKFIDLRRTESLHYYQCYQSWLLWRHPKVSELCNERYHESMEVMVASSTILIGQMHVAKSQAQMEKNKILRNNRDDVHLMMMMTMMMTTTTMQVTRSLLLIFFVGFASCLQAYVYNSERAVTHSLRRVWILCTVASKFKFWQHGRHPPSAPSPHHRPLFARWHRIRTKPLHLHLFRPRVSPLTFAAD